MLPNSADATGQTGQKSVTNAELSAALGGGLLCARTPTKRCAHGGAWVARRCLTKFHYHHDRGFFGAERKLIEKQEVKSVKSILYYYRVLLTGIHLMRSGEAEANIVRLAEEYSLSFIRDLIAMKTQEKVVSNALDWPFHSAQMTRLEQEMEATFNASHLPEERDRQAVHDWLVELRLRELAGHG